MKFDIQINDGDARVNVCVCVFAFNMLFADAQI